MTPIGSGELHQKSFHYQLEVGSHLFGWGWGLHNPSGPI